MPTVGFRISGIRAERYSFEVVQHLNINMNIMFSRPTKKDNSYVVDFVVKIECAPPVASMDIKGSVMVTPINVEEARRLEEDMSKPTPPQPLIVSVFSYTLPIVALLSRELGLPPPVQIPIQPAIDKEAQGHGMDYHM